jgi:hypothetical protein
MTTTATTIDTALARIGSSTDLASRENDGLAVMLLWNRATDRIKVAVADSRLDDEFELEVPSADALDAFNHPFAYAADRGLSFGDVLGELTDLQLQS